jgi:hypothetical protein
MLRAALSSALCSAGAEGVLDAEVVDYVAEIAGDVIDDEYCPDEEVAEAMNGVLFAMLDDNGSQLSPEEVLALCESVVKAVRHPEEAAAAAAAAASVASDAPPSPTADDASAPALPAPPLASEAASAPAAAAGPGPVSVASPSGGRAARAVASLPLSVWTSLLAADQQEYAESVAASLFEQVEDERRESGVDTAGEIAEQLAGTIASLLSDDAACSVEEGDVHATHALVREAKRRCAAVPLMELVDQLGAVDGEQRNCALLAACVRRLSSGGDARAASPDPAPGAGAVRLLSAPIGMGDLADQAERETSSMDLWNLHKPRNTSVVSYCNVGVGGEERTTFSETASAKAAALRVGEKLEARKLKAEKRRQRDRARRIAAGLDPDGEGEFLYVPLHITRILLTI